MSNTCDVFALKIKSATLLTVEEVETLLTKKEREYNCWWWLRSPGIYQDYAACVNIDGSVDCIGNYVNDDDGYVRPALEIDLQSSNLEVGDAFEFGDKKFKIISDKLAFCLEDIGMSSFRDDYDADLTNDYDYSDVQGFVNEWFEKAMVGFLLSRLELRLSKEVIPLSIEIKSATLLSIKEAETLLTKAERKYENWWWLRSPGYNQYDAAYVYSGGSVHYSGDSVLDEITYVRPALKISIESSDLKIGDTFDFGDKKFRIISETLAFCLEDIGKSCFRKDWLTPDANDYTHSDIKEYVDQWFEKAMDNNPRL